MIPVKKYFDQIAGERSTVPEVVSFRTIRKSIGWLGILLPFALMLGSWLFGKCCVLQPSISHYYYTNMRELFVGTLCAVALFLFTYKGQSMLDSWSANLAGLFCLMIALFPTGFIPFECQGKVATMFTMEKQWIVHYIAAACFFTVLALISMFLFTKSDKPPEERTPQKRYRNRVYRVCGVLMLGSIATIGSAHFFFETEPASTLTFWFETLALVSFGTSWLTKGEALLGDSTTGSRSSKNGHHNKEDQKKEIN